MEDQFCYVDLVWHKSVHVNTDGLGSACTCCNCADIVSMADGSPDDHKRLEAPSYNFNLGGIVHTGSGLHRTKEEEDHTPDAYSVYCWMYLNGMLSCDSVFRTRTVNTII